MVDPFDVTYGGVNVFDLLESKGHPSFADRPPLPRVNYDSWYDQLNAYIEAGLLELETASHAKRTVIYARYIAKSAVEAFKNYDFQKWQEAEAERAKRARA